MGLKHCYLWDLQKQSFRGVLMKSCSENMQQIYKRATIQNCDFNKVINESYRSHTLTWVFSYKFAAYFLNNFL